MQLSIRSFSAYDLPADVFAVLMVEPSLEGPHHRVMEESLRTTQTPRSALVRDTFGNPQRQMLLPAGRFSFEFTATVECEPNRAVPNDAPEHRPEELPADVFSYLLPSRYCQSDRLFRLAIDEFGKLPLGGKRVSEIAAWIRHHVEYRYGTTDSMTSAYDTVTQRVGVCRDFAHLLVALLRSLSIPARYVSGYALGLEPPDFHAWVQVYLGGQWHNVDATFDGIRPALVPIAYGRDAADVAMMTLFGGGTFREQSVEVRQIAP